MSRKYDLEERLISFAIRMMTIAEGLPQTKSGIHLAGQLTRSGTSPALNYGEAQGAESKRDFVHKMRIILKELRETLSNDDTDKIKEKTEDLSKAIQKASTAIYQQAAQEAAAQQQQAAPKGDNKETWSGHPSGDDKTIDADYKVKDDKKKSDDKKKKD